MWREARARSGRVLIRIEDHDRQRSRRHFEAAILEDLAWLGFEADEPPVRQSERGAIYEEALERLRRQHGLLRAIARARVAQGRPEGLLPRCQRGRCSLSGLPRQLWYPGTANAIADAPGRACAWLEPSVERFVDLRLSPQGSSRRTSAATCSRATATGHINSPRRWTTRTK